MGIDTRLAAMNMKIDSVDEKVDGLTHQFEKLDEKLDGKFSQYDKDSAVQALLVKILTMVVGGVTTAAIGFIMFGGG